MEQQQSCDVAGTDDLASPPLSQEDQPSSQSNVEDMNISIASLAINDDSEDTKEGEQQCEDQQQQQQPHDDNVGDTSITDAEVGDNNRNNETGTTTTIAAVSPVKSDAESVAATVQNILSTIIESAETVARDTLNNSNTTMEDFVDHIVVEDSGNNNSACNNNNNNNSNNNSAESVALPTEENVKGEGGAEAVEGLEKLVSLFQDGGDWSNRLEGLQQLQSMVMNPKYNNEAVRYIVTRVNSLLASQLGDPRSSIVREACQSLTCFSRQLGKDYQKYTLQVVPGLLRLHTSTIAAISATSQECLESILQQSGVSAHCHLHFLNFAETVCAPQRIPSTVTDVVANNKALKLKALAYIKELLVAQRETEVQTSTIDQQPFEDAVANIIQMNSEAPPTDHTANDVKLAATEIMKMITPTEKKPALGKSPAAVRTPTSAKKASTKPTLDKKSPTAGKSPSLIKKSTPTSAKLVSESARSPASPMPEGDSPSKKRRLLSTPVKPSHNAVVVDNHAGLASPSAPPTAKSRKMDSSPRNSPSNNNTNGQSPRGVKPPSPRFSQGAAPAKQTLTHSSASPKLSSTNKVGSTAKKTPHKSPLTSSSPAAVAAQFTSPIKNFELLDNNKIAFDFTSNSDASGVIVALANVEHTVDSDVATSATNCDHSNGSINDNNRGSETEERNQHPAMPTTTIGSIAITTDNNDNLAAGAQSAPESGSSHASKAPELPQKMMQSVETTTNDRKQEAQTTAAAEEATMISSTTTANNSDTVMDMVVEAQSQPPHQQEQPSSPPKPTVNNPVPTPAGPTDNNQLELLVAAQTAPMIMTSNNNDAATNAAVAAVTTAIMSCSPQNRAQQTSVIYKYTEEDLEKAKKAATQQALDEMDVINAQLEEMERLYNREQKERLALQATLAKYEELLLQQMQQQQQQQQHAAGVFTEEQYNTLLNVCKQHESSLNALQASYNELKDTYTRAQDENAQLNKKLDQAEQNYTKLKEFANKKLEETNSKASRLQQSIAQKDEQIKNLQELQHTVLPARDAEILRLRELVAKLEASNATTSNQLRSAEAREREHLSRIRALEDAAARKLEEEKQMLKRIEMETALRERELMAAKHQNSALSSQVFSKSAEIQLLQKKLAEATSNSPRTSSENDPTTQQQQQQQMNEMNEKYAKAQAEIRALQQELADKKREVAELFQMCQSLLDELDKRNNNTNNTNNINPSVTNNNNNNTQTPN